MSATKRAAWRALSLALVACWLGGCAGWSADTLAKAKAKLPKPPVPDVKPVREQRAKDAIHEFESRRDEAQYQAALSAWKQGDHKKSREQLLALVKRNPRHRAAQMTLIEQLVADDLIDVATERLATLETTFPGDPEVLQFMGAVYAAAGDDDKASECFEKSVQIAQAAEAEKPKVIASQEKPSAAVKLSPASVAKVPQQLPALESSRPLPPAPHDHKKIDAHLFLAEVCLGLNESHEAVRRLEAALGEYPDDAELHHMLARALEAAGRPVDAVAHYRRAAEIEPASTAYAVSFEQASASEAVRCSPKIHLAKPIERTEKTVAAKQTTASKPKTVAAKPPTPTNDVKVRKYEPSAEELVRQGTAALTAGAPTSAQTYFERALRAAPENEELAVTLAVTALRNDQPEMAAQLANEALKGHPKSAALYRVVGAAQYRLAHYKAAQVALQQALSLDNSQALSYFLMGCTLSKLGQLDAADWHLGQARQLDPRYAAMP
jgi:tetratricopeptide (TPR) repeat protein